MRAIERSFARNKAIVNTNESEVINSKHELYQCAESHYWIQKWSGVNMPAKSACKVSAPSGPPKGVIGASAV
jgi:hypothetical protein